MLNLVDAMLSELTAGSATDLYEPAASGSLVEAIVAHLPADSLVPAYLRRLLLADGVTGRELFRRLFVLSAGTLDALVASGLAAPGRDPAVRAAFRMSNDLAVLLLRGHLTDMLGADPLSGPGMARWASGVLASYGSGLLAAPPDSPL